MSWSEADYQRALEAYKARGNPKLGALINEYETKHGIGDVAKVASQQIPLEVPVDKQMREEPNGASGAYLDDVQRAVRQRARWDEEGLTRGEGGRQGEALPGAAYHFMGGVPGVGPLAQLAVRAGAAQIPGGTEALQGAEQLDPHPGIARFAGGLVGGGVLGKMLGIGGVPGKIPEALPLLRNMLAGGAVSGATHAVGEAADFAGDKLEGSPETPEARFERFKQDLPHEVAFGIGMGGLSTLAQAGFNMVRNPFTQRGQDFTDYERALGQRATSAKDGLVRAPEIEPFYRNREPGKSPQDMAVDAVRAPVARAAESLDEAAQARMGAENRAYFDSPEGAKPRPPTSAFNAAMDELESRAFSEGSALPAGRSPALAQFVRDASEPAHIVDPVAGAELQKQGYRLLRVDKAQALGLLQPGQPVKVPEYAVSASGEDFATGAMVDAKFGQVDPESIAKGAVVALRPRPMNYERFDKTVGLIDEAANAGRTSTDPAYAPIMKAIREDRDRWPSNPITRPYHKAELGMSDVRVNESGMRESSSRWMDANMSPEGIQKNPVVVERYPDGTVLGDGRHRVQWAQKNGIREVPAIVRTYDDAGNLLSEESKMLSTEPGTTGPSAMAGAHRDEIGKVENVLRNVGLRGGTPGTENKLQDVGNAIRGTGIPGAKSDLNSSLDLLGESNPDVASGVRALRLTNLFSRLHTSAVSGEQGFYMPNAARVPASSLKLMMYHLDPAMHRMSQSGMPLAAGAGSLSGDQLQQIRAELGQEQSK